MSARKSWFIAAIVGASIICDASVVYTPAAGQTSLADRERPGGWSDVSS